MPIQTIPCQSGNDIQLHYQHHTCHESSSVPLLLLSGMASDSASWQPVVDRLNISHELVLPDNRCTGRTSPMPVLVNRELMVADLVVLLDKLQIERVNVLGHSMGGMLGWALAAAQPARVNCLICASALPFVIPARVALFNSLSAFRSDTNEAEWFELLFQFLFSPEFFNDPDAVKAAVKNSMNYPYKQNKDAFATQVAGLSSFLSPPDTHNVQCPVTLLTGGNDLLMTPRLLEKFRLENPHLSCHVVPDAAHAIHWEQPDAFASIVEQALSGLELAGT